MITGALAILLVTMLAAFLLPAWLVFLPFYLGLLVMVWLFWVVGKTRERD